MLPWYAENTLLKHRKKIWEEEVEHLHQCKFPFKRGFFFSFKVRILKKCSIKQGVFICACKTIILVCQKSLNLAIFTVKCLLIHNKASTYKYKCCTHTTKSCQYVSAEDKPLSIFQLSKSCPVSFTWCPNGLGMSNKNEDRKRNLVQLVRGPAVSIGLRCRVHSEPSFYC